MSIKASVQDARRIVQEYRDMGFWARYDNDGWVEVR